ncbi:MAG: LysR family transcriptional regulator [Clostridia bacterium]|nr:LysR family transcriptional regulator [Clostridia bacterium]
MEIRVLKYFLTVAREESISRAAEVLHITQPTLSRQLAQLEEETGVRLFRRGARKIELTAEGLLLRRRAEEIVELAERTAADLSRQARELEGTVAVGCGEVAGAEILTRLCGTFRERHPKVTFDLYTAAADAVKERMERGLIDVGLLLEPVDLERFAFIRLPVRERFVLVMRPDDPLAQKESVTREDLADLPLILPRRLNVQSELASWFGDRFDALNVAFTGNLPSNKLAVVHQGYGYAIVAEGLPEARNPACVTSRPLEPELTAGTVLAWKRGQPFGRAAEAFIEHIRCFSGMD